MYASIDELRSSGHSLENQENGRKKRQKSSVKKEAERNFGAHSGHFVWSDPSLETFESLLL